MGEDVVVERAALDDVEALVPLFDGYRQFYQQPSDPAAARSFLSDRPFSLATAVVGFTLWAAVVTFAVSLIGRKR